MEYEKNIEGGGLLGTLIGFIIGPLLIPLVIIGLIAFIIWYFWDWVYNKFCDLIGICDLSKAGKKIETGLKQLGKSKIPLCNKGYKKSAGLCYKHCKKGYKKSGLFCYQTCPKGFRNDGLYCAKPKPYGRGGGYPWKFGDKAFSLGNAKKRCEEKNKKSGCEKSGAIYYPKCKSGFRKIGCCICSPKCQKGMKDIGVSCAKKQYGGGVGKIPKNCDFKGKNKYFYKALRCYPRNV